MRGEGKREGSGSARARARVPSSSPPTFSRTDTKAFLSPSLPLCSDLWLAAAQRVFADLGGDAATPGSSISPAGLVDALRAKLPAAAVEYAVEDALLDAGLADAEALDFEGFLRLLRTSGGALGPNPNASDPDASVHGLSQYDARLVRRPPSLDGGDRGGVGGGGGGAGGRSTHGGGSRRGPPTLAPVAELRHK